MKRIRTTRTPYQYIHKIHGCLFVTWVSEKHKAHAQEFPDDTAAPYWRDLLTVLAGEDVVVEDAAEPDLLECHQCGRRVSLSTFVGGVGWSSHYSHSRKRQVRFCPVCSLPHPL